MQLFESREKEKSVLGSSGHDARCNAHGHQLLEQQLAGIGNVDLRDLDKQRNS